MPNPIGELVKLVKYEIFFLEQVYRLTTVKAIPDIEIELSYGSDGKSRRKVSASAHLDMSDWRPGFLAAGAPLIFVTAFKIIDLIVDWMLKTPSKPAPLQFSQKLEALKRLPSIELPDIFLSDVWLYERFVAIYGQAAEFRNTLIHRSDFSIDAAGLHIFGRDKKKSGRLSISPNELAIFSEVALSVFRLAAGVLSIDLFTRKHVRWMFDELSFFHKQPLLGQYPVQLGRASIRFSEMPTQLINLAQIRQDIAPSMHLKDRYGCSGVLKYDVVFELHIVVEKGASGAREEYLIPYDEVSNYADYFLAEAILTHRIGEIDESDSA